MPVYNVKRYLKDCVSSIKNSTYQNIGVILVDDGSNDGIVYCEVEFFGVRKGRWLLPKFTLQKMLVNNIIFVTAMFRRSDWECVGGYSEDMVSGIEDYDFWLSIFELERTVYRIPEVLFAIESEIIQGPLALTLILTII